MRETIVDEGALLAEDRKLIKQLWKVDKNENFPDGLKFVYQFLYFKDNKWTQIARIDNQLHKGKPGTHIHILKRGKVKWERLSFEEAEEKILEIGENVIKNIINKI